MNPVTTLHSHSHATTLGEAGACPSCRQRFIDLCADGPYGWVLSFPDTHQVAVVRTWEQSDDEPACTAWATGCNTGSGAVGWESLDPATIEKSGVEMFTLLSGSAAHAALDALGITYRPWNHDVAECPSCGPLSTQRVARR